MGEPKVYTFRSRITKVEKHSIEDNCLMQSVKRTDQGYFDMSNRYTGSNATYLEFGEYHGMALDVTFSLYDADKQFIEINNESYRIPSHVRVNIYKELMTIWGIQRMSSQRYDAIMEYEGKEVDFIFGVMENKIMRQIEDDMFAINIVCTMPFLVENQFVTSMCNINIVKVK